MKLRVSHLTRYEYDREVGFGSHILYLRPRESVDQRLLFHRLSVQPDARLIPLRDAQDNNFIQAHFWEHAAALNIRSEFEVERQFPNPFDFLLEISALSIPFRYEEGLLPVLAPCLATTDDTGEETLRLRAWLDEHFVDRPSETIPFLSALNQLLYQQLGYLRREEGAVQAPRLTLELGGGACRDYAWLFVALARTLGIAARFVSGYLHAPNDDRRSAGAMHAWAEVYLPGAGWRGLDPTHGIWCDDNFIAVAHAARAQAVNPVQGSLFTAGAAHARLHVDVRVERVD
jgi:transglutaminase-like putative cysteine protease